MRMAKAGMARAAAVRRASIMYGRCKGGSEGGEYKQKKRKRGKEDGISLLSKNGSMWSFNNKANSPSKKEEKRDSRLRMAVTLGAFC